MSEENVNPVDPAASANANRNFLLARDDVEEIDQDGTSAQLNLMYQKLCNEAVNVKSASELKVFKEETHKQFLDYIKKNKHQKYIDMATKQIHLIQARINE